MHVERELPEVRREIKALLAETEGELSSLGDERPTVAHLRMFLTRKSMEFHSLARAALDGNYYDKDGDFFDNPAAPAARLRAEVHRLNGNFANYMRENGQKRKLCNRDPSELSAGSETESEDGDSQVLVKEQELNSWVKRVRQTILVLHSILTSYRRICGHGGGSSQAIITMFSSQSCSTSSLAAGKELQRITS